MKRPAFFTVMLLAMRLAVYSQANQTPVIIIIADQLRFDAIGQFTPHINQLKADGVSFNRTYCATPLCAPSRAAFFTGKYPNNNGSLINGWQIEDGDYKNVKAGTPNLYEAMAGNWDSWHVGKQHFFTQDKIDTDPQSKTKWITQQTYKQWVKSQGVNGRGGRGFSAMSPQLLSGRYTGFKNYSIPTTEEYKPGMKYFDDEYFAKRSVDIIKEHKSNKPLLLNLMFLSPHPPFNVPEPYFSKFKTGDLSIPENVGQWYPGQSTLQLYNLTGFFGTRYSREEWSQIWLKYVGLVSLLDDKVGEVVAALKSAGMYEKALIIFTADHGEMLGSHSLWQKMCMYEESARVPLIVKFPASFKPSIKQTDKVVSLVDVWPTLQDYLNIKTAGKTDGISLLPLVQGKKHDRTGIFIQYDGNGSYGNNQRCVVDGEYKLIVDSFKDEYFLELYNVIKDPQEKQNLVTDPQYKATTKTLLSRIRKYMTDTNDRLQLPDQLYENFLLHYLKKSNAADGGD